MRSVITIVTEGEKPPGLMGFAFEEDGPAAGQLEPQVDPGDAVLQAPDDDIQGAEIEGPIEVDVEGLAVGEAQIVVQPAKDDEIIVDGITLKSGSSLAALRAACSSYGISSSGGKLKCFSRLVNHQKKLELQTITHAAQDALNAQVRVPNAPALPEPPSEAAQDLHRLTHTPYQPWCESCVAHRARADRHAHDFSSKDGSCPTISFDYFYTKAGEQSQEPDALVALILVDSKTGYLGCVPMNSKGQFDLATKEIIAFCQTLPMLFHYDATLLLGSHLQLQRLTVQARQQMGLETQACTPSAYEHGNALAENAIQRVRGLAGSLMHNLQSKLAVTISSNHALWSWCMRHAAWILNRYNPHQGLTAFEVVYGKQYQGQICEYGEPVLLGFARTPLKGNPKWRRMVFLGKVEGQDSLLLYDGTSLILTRSVRRVKTNWVVYMAYYKQFNLFSWQYKVGFGGRVQPTKRRVGPRPASMAPPLTAVEPSKLVDEDAEAEERREEAELEMMSAFDKPQEVQREVQFGDGRIFEDESQELQPVVPGPQPLLESSMSAMPSSDLSSNSTTQAIQPGIGLEVPVTPPMTISPASPRHSSTTRTHDDDLTGESEMKRSKTEEAKKQRINRLAAEQERCIRTVKIGEEVYHTLDSYADEPQLSDEVQEDPWLGEEELHFAGVDERLWSDHPLTEQPPDPGDEVDKLADEVEINRLLEMKVLVASSDYSGDDVKGRLTTKFVKDWRKKVYVSLSGESRERWMRRSRLVAREYANTKRDDTFSPATGAHTSNLLPVYFLDLQVQCKELDESYQPVLASLDIKDAFLQVEQEQPIEATLWGSSSICFLKKRLVSLEDGILIAPGTPVQKIIDSFEQHFGAARSQLIPCDNSILMEDVSTPLNAADVSHYRSVVGMLMYLSRDRPDCMFTIKELAGRMSSPTLTSLQHLRKIVGYLKQTGDVGIKLIHPSPGHGKLKVTSDRHWILETYSDSDWMGNRVHRRSTSCAVHVVNGNYVFSSSRTQKAVALSSCEAELYSIVSSMSDSIFIRYCLEFMVQGPIMQVQHTDSSSARQLLARQGSGRIRHLSGKVLWVQSKVQSGEVIVSQVPTIFNLSDVGTKPLSKRRLLALMGETGMVFVESQQPVGQEERADMQAHGATSRNMCKLAKTILRLTVMMGLEPTGANGQDGSCPIDTSDSKDSFWIGVTMFALVFSWLVFGGVAFWFWRKLDKRLYWNELQMADQDDFAGKQQDQLVAVRTELETLSTRFDGHIQDFNEFVEQTSLLCSNDLLVCLCQRYGLIEIGGFVRHRELTQQLRSSMLIQERANMVMFDNKNRYPDDTDVSMPGPSSSMPARPSSSAAAAGSATCPANEMHDDNGAEEEESETDDEMDDGEEPSEE
eukprot:s2167_g7.t1